MSGNAVSVVSRDGMTRAPVVRFSRAYHAHEAKLWLEDEDNHRLVMDAFNSTSRSLHCNVLLLVLRDYSTHLSAFSGPTVSLADYVHIPAGILTHSMKCAYFTDVSAMLTVH